MQRVILSKLAAFAATVLACLCATYLYAGGPSADLVASWVAGQQLHAGSPGLVYPGYAGTFTLHPHPDWPAFLEASGYIGPVFPFIYPPLWAWAIGHIETYEAFRAFAVYASLANIALLAGSVWLARRIMGTGLPPLAYVALGAVLLGGTTVGVIPMLQGQPQILVSFLLLLTIERALFGHPIVAGIALALAASIKLYPAVFALIWLARGDWKSLAAFGVAGGTLALTSVGVAGWDLHLAFLHDVAAISNSILVTGLTTSLQSLIAQAFMGADLLVARPVEVNRIPPADAQWLYSEAPLALALAGKAALLAIVGAAAWAARSASKDRLATVIWPLALTASALVLPISWTYYFIPVLALLPGIAWRMGRVWGTATLLMVYLPLSLPVIRATSEIQPQIVALPFIGLTIVLWLAAKRAAGAPITQTSETKTELSFRARA